MAMSPAVIVLERAAASDASRALPGSAAAPARPTPFRNERRPTTRCQRACMSSSVDAEDWVSERVVVELSLGMVHPSLLGIDWVVRVWPALRQAVSGKAPAETASFVTPPLSSARWRLFRPRRTE